MIKLLMRGYDPAEGEISYHGKNIREYNLNKAMHNAAQSKTVFYISHRLSTTRDADRIIMLERGRIIEEGSHEQLLGMNGQYARMWHVQAGKYGE